MKLPFSWPNSSDSIRLGEIAPQLTAMKAWSARGLMSCTVRAISSLPVPDSPMISTVASVPATLPIWPYSVRMTAEWPYRWPKSGSATTGADTETAGGLANAVRRAASPNTSMASVSARSASLGGQGRRPVVTARSSAKASLKDMAPSWSVATGRAGERGHSAVGLLMASASSSRHIVWKSRAIIMAGSACCMSVMR